jgi:hypothetical protein
MHKPAMKSAALALLCATSLPALAESSLSFTHLDTYTEACADESCAEISAFDPATSRVFITNAEENQLRILEIDADAKFVEIGAVDLSTYGGGPNSVAISNGMVAVAMEANDKTENGSIELFDTDGLPLNIIPADALPDMLTFTPDGQFLAGGQRG